MSTINYDNCKKVYELYKQVYFWAQKNEFRNSVFALEEVASFLWDIDQELSQKMYDLVHSMDDAIYNKQNKLNEFLPKANSLKIQVYSNCLSRYYTYYKRLVTESNETIKACRLKDLKSYQKAMSLATHMESIDKSITAEYLKKIKQLMDYNYGDYIKLSVLVQDYCGKLFKIKMLDLEESFK